MGSRCTFFFLFPLMVKHMKFNLETTEIVLVISLILVSLLLAIPTLWQVYKLIREYRRVKESLGENKSSFGNIFERWRKEWTHESSVLAVPDKYLRHDDGSYTAAWTIETGNTLFMKPEDLNRIYSAWAEIIGREERFGLIYQIRATTHIDTGGAYAEFMRGFQKRGIETLPEAHYWASAAHTLDRQRRADFRAPKTSLWVKVPTKVKGDQEFARLSSYWKVFKESLSIRDFFRAWGKIYAMSSNNIVRRLRENEEKARLEAEKIFRSIESNAPTHIRRLTKDELKTAIYLGHNESAKGTANLNETIKDLRPFLGGETIAYGDEVIWHANTPIALLTLNRAPGTDTEVGIMRAIVCNPSLNFRYTVVTDFIPMTNAKAERKLKTNIKRIGRQIKKDSEKKNAADDNPAARKNMERLIGVREKLGEPSTRLLQTRVSILIYAPAIFDREYAKNAAKYLEEASEQTFSVVRRMPGADAVRESGVHLPNLYPTLIAGELSAKLNGRELDGECRDMIALAPIEGHWHGTGKKAETWIESLTGELVPLTFFRPAGTTSPVAYIIAGAGGGKSFFIGKEIRNWLAYFKNSKAVVVDFGGSYEWLARALGGRVFRFSAKRDKGADEGDDGGVLTYNIWWYPGLEEGGAPDDAQIELVVREILRLSGTPADSAEAPVKAGLIRMFVKRVYENTVPRNRPDLNRTYEPRLSDFIGVLENFAVEREPEIQKAWTDLKLTLQQWRGNPWLDAPTSPILKESSRFVIYDLDTLKEFPDQVKDVLAFRTAAMVLNSDLMKVDGNFVHTLKVFDEMHNHTREYPMMADAIDIAARQDRKKMGTMLLASHSFKDIRAVRGATTNAAIKIAGKQNSTNLLDDSGEKTEFKALIDDMNLTPLAVEEIKQIRGGGKSFREFVIKIESGAGGEIGFVRNDSSPLDYWCLTTTPEEVNARRLAFELVEHILGTDQIFNYLAQKYPFGLPEGEEFDKTELANFAMQVEAERLKIVQLDEQQKGDELLTSGESSEKLNDWLKSNNTTALPKAIGKPEQPLDMVRAANVSREEADTDNDSQLSRKVSEVNDKILVLSQFDDLSGEK